MADRAPDRPSWLARCRGQCGREHGTGLRRRNLRQLRHRMRPADQRRRRGHGASRRCARPPHRRGGPARRHDGSGAQARRLQGDRRPHADPRRTLRSGGRPRDAGAGAQGPLRGRPSSRHANRDGARRLCAARSRPCRSIPASLRPCAILPPRSPGAWSRNGAIRMRAAARARRRCATPARRLRPIRSSSPTGCRICTSAVPLLARHVLGMPLLTWTVRTAEDRARAARFADQMIFEGFRP